MVAKKVKPKRKQIKKRKKKNPSEKDQQEEIPRLPGQSESNASFLSGKLRNVVNKTAAQVGGSILDFCKAIGCNPEKKKVGELIAICLTEKLFDTGNPKFFELVFDRVDGKQSLIGDQDSPEDKAVQIHTMMKQMYAAGAPPFPQEVPEQKPAKRKKKIVRSRKRAS